MVTSATWLEHVIRPISRVYGGLCSAGDRMSWSILGRRAEHFRRNVTTVFFDTAGLKERIGISVSDAMQKNEWDDKTQSFEPEAARLLRNISSLGDGRIEDPSSWDLRLTSQECARADAALEPIAKKPIIAVSVGTKVQSKDWGRENWRALLAQLATLYPHYGLILSGAPEEGEASEYAAEGWRQAGVPRRLIFVAA